MKPDTEWFKYQIESRHESIRKFCKKIIGKSGNPLDVSAVSLVIRGKRQLTVDEAYQYAELLGVDVAEILKRYKGN